MSSPAPRSRAHQLKLKMYLKSAIPRFDTWLRIADDTTEGGGGWEIAVPTAFFTSLHETLDKHGCGGGNNKGRIVMWASLLVFLPSLALRKMACSCVAGLVLLCETSPHVRPLASKDLSGVVVFVNSKSGGLLGGLLIQRLREMGGGGGLVVCDLGEGVGPDAVLASRAPTRVMVAGGDGTARWVLGAVGCPAIGIIPLGTGNDLSRALGWGAKVEAAEINSKAFIGAQLAKLFTASRCTLDRWDVDMGDSSSSPQTMINYFSLGLDARIALKFHNARNENAEGFARRSQNMTKYAMFGLQELGAAGGSPSLSVITLHLDGVSVEVPTSIEGIVIANIGSYHGGVDFWGASSPPSRFDDGRVEVMGLTGSRHIAAIHIGTEKALRLGQGSVVDLVVMISKDGMAMQIDGEPWLQGAQSSSSLCKIRFTRQMKGSEVFKILSSRSRSKSAERKAAGASKPAPKPVAKKAPVVASPAKNTRPPANPETSEMLQALKLHNSLRLSHGADALRWDAECYKTALAWCAVMVEKSNMFHGGHNGMGQNLAWSSGSGLSMPNCVQMWYDEVNDPGYDFTKPTFDMGTGHFTQVVWKGTTHVGIASMKSDTGTYVCANYYPPGNCMGRFAENVFPAGGVPPSGSMPLPRERQSSDTLVSEEQAAIQLQKFQRGKQDRGRVQDLVRQKSESKLVPGGGGTRPVTVTCPTGAPMPDAVKAKLHGILYEAFMGRCATMIAEFEAGGVATITVSEDKPGRGYGKFSLMMKKGGSTSNMNGSWG